MNIEKDVLTTGEVAKICNVAPRTVSKWFDSGSLKGYRIPGSKDRRIPASQLVKFMKAHGIPFDGVLSGRTRVMIVDDEQEVLDVLAKVLSPTYSAIVVRRRSSRATWTRCWTRLRTACAGFCCVLLRTVLPLEADYRES